MCESTAFVRRGADEQLLLSEVATVELVVGGYMLRNLFGEEITVQGEIEEINLLKHKILFRSK